MIAQFPVTEHPTLGSIKGIEVLNGVHQYRGFPYAKVPARWQHSTVLSTLKEANSSEGATYDATTWGPMSPQPAGSISIDFGLIQKELPYTAEERRMDEYECLNLVLTKPGVVSGAKLPVLFIIHGGAFFIGANSWPQYDTSRLVEWGNKIGKPFIAVSINYRLGHLGFLSSTELGPNDAPGNFGLVDQQNALRWVKANIAGFGGDPENITCFGESAGAISTHLHLLRGEQLFSRAACLSGDVTVRPIQTLEKQQGRYEELVKRLGITASNAEGRVAQLKNTSWEDLVKDPANARPFPTLAGGYKDVASDKTARSQQCEGYSEWCRELLVSACLDDGSLYMRAFIDKPWEEQFDEALKRYLSPEEAQLVRDTWQIGKRKSDQNPVDLGLVQFITDVRFYWPVMRTLESAPANAKPYVYHFHQANPFDGIAKGLASHELDLALLLLNYSSDVDATTVATSELLATHILEFIYGALSNDKSSAAIIDHGVKRVVAHEVYDKEERCGAAEVMKKIGPEKCFNALELFQFGEIN